MKIVNLLLCLLCLIMFAGCHSAPSTKEISAVQPFSLNRYLGTWYEIARLPHSFEKDLMDVKAEYTLREDGKINVLNSGTKNNVAKKITGIAKFKGAPDIGELRVSFFRPFYGDYKIIALTEDYTISLVTSSTKDYLWLLARTPTLDQTTLESFLAQIQQLGFDTSKLIFPQNTRQP